MKQLSSFLKKAFMLSCYSLFIFSAVSAQNYAPISSPQVAADVYSDKQSQEQISLSSALLKLEKSFSINFGYTDHTVKDKYVNVERLKEVKLELILENILTPLNLKYQKVDKSFYLIVNEAIKEDLPLKIEKEEPGKAASSQSFSLAKSFSHKSVTIVKTMDITVSGKVTDIESGEALPGVNVLVKNSLVGTVTDVEGQYNITVANENDILIFSSIGYLTQEVAVNGRGVIDLAMAEDVQSLEEVVVVGYGTQKRSDVTGSVASISAEDISDIPMANISTGLAGRIPGLDIVSSGAGPGAENKILLRGQRSFTASNDPLIILDGSPYYGTLNDINPYDIKNVNVLKDASSTAIYGARGANGVIIITTKRGTSGSPKFRIESFAGPQLRYGRLPFANGEQYAEIGREAYRAMGGYPESETSLEDDERIFDAIEMEAIKKGGAGLDYQDLLFQSGHQQKHQLSVIGGSEAVKYNFSGSYFNEEGIIPGETFSRFNLRSNLDFTLSSKITAGASILLNYTLNQRKTNGALNQTFQSSPLGKLYEDDGSPRFTATTDGLVLNPLADYIWDSYRWDNKRWGAFVNTFAQVEIIPGLTYRLNLGTNLTFGNTKESAGYYSLIRNLGTPTAQIDNMIDNLKMYESIITYDKNYSEKHHVTVTGVHGIQVSSIDNSLVGVSDLPYEPSRAYNLGSASNINAVGSNLEETALISYAGRLFYGYDNKYMLTISMRADGASQFSSNHKWGYFPSVAVAYNVTEEEFMQGTKDWLSGLKLRLSYGITGNQAINPYQTQGKLTIDAYSWNESPGFGYRPTELSNQDLRWESTEVYNLGVDVEFLEGRIQGNLDIYNTNTYDLLMFRNLPITSGYNQVLQNVGSTNNKGFELSLSTVNLNIPSFTWSSDFTFFRNRTRIEELYNGKEDDIGNRWFIGQPINVYYDFQKVGIWQLNEVAEAKSYGREPGQIKVIDFDEDGSITDNDRLVLGSREPDFIANLVNRFSYKNWDVSINTYMRWGGMTSVSSFAPFAKKRYNKMVFDYWTPTNPTNDYPRPNQLYEGSGLNGNTLTYRDASIISLRQLSLGYTLPEGLLNILPISNARIYLLGDNLLYWTKSELREFNMKPDFSEDITPYPAIRTFIVGVNLSF
ncbi:TonB-linked SusC/RagA family outer membrane protein [Catalinimonas alkaloidigena]|uniref:SusC/RagA family TonB-linked outer membrane protein n=1 Tax=Catalinimonas alkaloidigena TaxID=1075417 RepID=UPI0024062FF8|nr:TonB-dependent receptor [Catalinimonas alkaloidigena]MDF9798876.1 TonB-linked SusC/RagA family outer membrane protein [Catalinimonas alkaloidigena]